MEVITKGYLLDKKTWETFEHLLNNSRWPLRMGRLPRNVSLFAHIYLLTKIAQDGGEPFSQESRRMAPTRINSAISTVGMLA